MLVAPPVTVQLDTVQRGAIARPGEVDRFRLRVARPVAVFLDARPATAPNENAGCGRNRTFRWSLRRVGAAAPVVAERSLYASGFCRDYGSFPLRRSGTYELAVRGLGDATGPYAFVLWRPRFDTLRIRPRLLVRPGVPRRGAGRIERPGSVDVYRFHVRGGNRLFLDVRALDGSCGTRGGELRWSLFVHGRRQPVFADELVASFGTCRDQGPFTVVEGADYDVVVYGRLDAVADYSFRVLVLPP